jgi:hypothetical protein
VSDARKRTSRTAVLAATTVAALLAAAPAQAQSPANTMDAGKVVNVFGNADFVATFGWTVGDIVTVEVFRGSEKIGHASGPAVDTPDGGALEVNHGPAGAPEPGDCWDGDGGPGPAYTPDLLPEDRIVITGPGPTPLDPPSVSTVYVDDIEIPKPAKLVGDSVVVEGIARTAQGLPLRTDGETGAAPLLDSGEVRAVGPRVRATPNETIRIPGTTDRWRSTYHVPFAVFQEDPGLDNATRRSQILNGDHAQGYGHAAPVNGVAQLADGVGADGGPALGCEASVSQRDAIQGANREAINAANVGQPLVVNGVVADGDTVRVRVPGGAQHDPVVNADNTWTATIPAAEIGDLPDGNVVVTADFQGPLAPATGARVTQLTLSKDIVAPAAPTANPPAGSYEGTRNVTLSGETGATIRYTNNNSEPTSSSPIAGGPIPVTASQTLKAKAFDAAGNPSATGTFAYVITAPPVQNGGGGGGGGTNIVPAFPGPPGPGPTGPSGSSVPAPLTLAHLSTSARIKRSTARRKGVRVVTRLNSGTQVLRLRVYRKKGATKTLLGQGFRAPSSAGLYRVTLQDSKLRRSLSVGSYELEVTPGRGPSSMGTASKYAFKVVR